MSNASQLYNCFASTSQQKRFHKVRREIIQLLGGRCSRCGYDEDWRVFQVDHVKGFPTEDDRRISRNPYRLRRDILNNPTKYQLLCANCNQIKRYQNHEHSNSNIYGYIAKPKREISHKNVNILHKLTRTNSAHVAPIIEGEHIITITPRLMSRCGLSLVCHRCDMPLKVGDVVISKHKTRGNAGQRYFHAECWREIHE